MQTLLLQPGHNQLAGMFGAVTVHTLDGPDAGNIWFTLKLVNKSSPPSSHGGSRKRVPDTFSPMSGGGGGGGLTEDVSWGAAAFKELACKYK